ncbi:MAG: hypothetical protein ACM3O3_01725 [Syntrophothermus sp.]
MKYIFIFFIILFFSGCGKEDKKEAIGDINQQVEYSPAKDKNIQEYNIEQLKQQSIKRTPCDTISLMEYVLNNYPEGSYLIYFDKTISTSVPRPAVIYTNQNGRYVFGIVAKSRPGERLIETKNIIGFDQSYIDLDSTELGTAFFYLTLFECVEENDAFNVVWEAPIPSHGGFNNVTMEKWFYKGIPYLKINFHYAQGVGHIDYNYFLVDGLLSQPHLLMTYEGINFKRTIANIDNDKYPDYYEHIFYDLGDRVYSNDSVGFVWRAKDSVYVNTRNSRQTRPY